MYSSVFITWDINWGFGYIFHIGVNIVLKIKVYLIDLFWLDDPLFIITQVHILLNFSSGHLISYQAIEADLDIISRLKQVYVAFNNKATSNNWKDPFSG